MRRDPRRPGDGPGRRLRAPFPPCAASRFRALRGAPLLAALLSAFALPPRAAERAFVHPGMLHREEDLARMRARVGAGDEPWLSGWRRLTANSHASAGYVARPVDTVYRGTGTPENYSRLYNDAAAAYALALRWRVSGDTAFAGAAVRILDAWSASLKAVSGTSDKYLAAGIYGYQLANAAELLRGYAGWPPAGFRRFRDMLLAVFLPMNRDFLVRHNGACISHYWANWDLVNMASLIGIGILADSPAVYGEAVRYFKEGAGNGAIRNAVWHLHPGGLGQWQESGRDQGHSLMGPAVLGAFLEMAWNQGDDLYGHDDNRALKGFEYVARYNLGEDVPFEPYDNCDRVDQRVISDASRGGLRPGWELLYNHYENRRGIPAPYSRRYAETVRPEGGGGDYGPNSGGFDQLGYGTLTATLPRGPASLAPGWDGVSPLLPGARRAALRPGRGWTPGSPAALADLTGRVLAVGRLDAGPGVGHPGARAPGLPVLRLESGPMARGKAVLRPGNPGGPGAGSAILDR